MLQHISAQYTDISYFSEMNGTKRGQLYKKYKTVFSDWQKEKKDNPNLHNRIDWLEDNENTCKKTIGAAEIIRKGNYNPEEFKKIINDKKTPQPLRETLQTYLNAQILAKLFNSAISEETIQSLKQEKKCDEKILSYISEFEKQPEQIRKAGFKEFLAEKLILTDNDLKAINFAKNNDFKNYMLTPNPNNNEYEIELLRDFIETADKNKLKNSIHNNSDKIIVDEIKNIEIAIDKTNNIQDGTIGSFCQGGAGDCWFLGTLDSIAQSKKGARIIKNSIKKSNNGYIVTFPIDGKPIEVSEKEIQENIMRDLKGNPFLGKYDEQQTFSFGDKDVRILEIAANKYYLKNENVSLNGGDKQYHRYLTDDLFRITSEKDLEILKNMEQSSETYQKTRENLGRIIDTPQSQEKLTEFLKKHNPAQLTCGTYKPKDIKSEKQTEMTKKFQTNHLYNIVSYNTDNKVIRLANPYDNAHLIEASYDEFINMFKEIYVMKEL